MIGERERVNLVVYTSGNDFSIIGERERANLVVQLAAIFLYIYI